MMRFWSGVIGMVCGLSAPTAIAYTYEAVEDPAVVAETVADMDEIAEPIIGELRIDDLTELRRLPVLHNGRKMPLQTYARLLLVQLSGRTTYQGEAAESWLARLMLDPVSTLDDRVFLINHPEVAQALTIPVDENRRYSFTDLHGAMGRLGNLAQRAARLASDDRSQVENELLRLYANQVLYLDIYHSFEFARPHPAFAIDHDELIGALDLPPQDQPYRFFDIFVRAGSLQSLIEPLATKPPDQWSDLEHAAYELSSRMYDWSRRHQESTFVMIPLMSHGEETWLSAWDSFALGFRDAGSLEILNALAEMAEAYQAGQQLDFDMAARHFRRLVSERLDDDRAMGYLDWEVRLNDLNLFNRATWLYGWAFFISLFALMGRGRWPYGIGLTLLVLAFVLHSTGMIMRMVIMGRPPMTNLYATFIFVSWVCVILGFFVELFQRNRMGLLTGSLSGVLLLMFSRRFEMEGDTMGAVVAVLDSNFWLSTHVTTITAGYAGCLLAGVIGHVWLLQAAINPMRTERLRSIYYAMMAMLAFGLTFSFLGTMLGGVWADQSWGRFWGWDPKENGALLIVLWTAVLYHARLGRMIGDVAMAAGTIVGAIIVMMAWLGVNLLGVGLHSYGFTSGLAMNLFLYTAFELVFIAVMAPLAKYRLVNV